MTRSIRRKSAVAGVLLAAVTLAVTACSGNTALPGSDASSTASGDSVLAGAPVAKADLILSGSTMEKIKKRGKLIVAEALDAPLLSQQDPTDPQKVNGFDAELAKLLAIYILGKPNVEIVPPASATREAMLQNDTVDVVFNTYTITEERAKQVGAAMKMLGWTKKRGSVKDDPRRPRPYVRPTERSPQANPSLAPAPGTTTGSPQSHSTERAADECPF